MVLSDKQILECIEKGTVVIHPLMRENINTSSYDLTLGDYYYRQQRGPRAENFYNPFQESHTRAFWGEPQRAEKALEILEEFKMDWDNCGIDPAEKVILIYPGETILGHTQEFIGGKTNITTQMQARSTIGRNCLEVCKCAGWGDVGFTNRWTMEITNNSKDRIIPLVVGRRIAQLVFYETGELLGNDYTEHGKYTSAGSVEELEKSWIPDQMIPKMWRDREVLALLNKE